MSSLDLNEALSLVGAKRVDSPIHGTFKDWLCRLRHQFWEKEIPQDQIWDIGSMDLRWTRGKLALLEGYGPVLQRIHSLRNNTERFASRGLLITGGPGIGKTSCLWYLLVTTICHGQPVVLFCENNLYVLSPDAVYVLDGSDQACILQAKLFSGVLCLIDMDWETSGPLSSSVLSRHNRCFAVAATDHHHERYSRWARQCNIATYIFPSPTEKDFRNLYGLVTSAIENEELARYLSQLLENFEPNIRRVIPLLYDQGRYHGFSSFP